MKKFVINKNQKLGRREITAPKLTMTEFNNLVHEKLLDYAVELTEDEKTKLPAEIWDKTKVNSSLICGTLINLLYEEEEHSFNEKIKTDLCDFCFSPKDYEIFNTIIVKGIPIIEYTICYNYGPGTIIYFYWDGTSFRAYLPYVGNYINIDEGSEIYQDLTKDVEYLDKQGLRLKEDYKLTKDSEPDEIYSTLKWVWQRNGIKMDISLFPIPNYEACKKDLEACIKDGKRN